MDQPSDRQLPAAAQLVVGWRASGMFASVVPPEAGRAARTVRTQALTVAAAIVSIHQNLERPNHVPRVYGLQLRRAAEPFLPSPK